MRAKLTNASVKKLTAADSRFEVADSETPALRVRVTPAGVKTFILLYRNVKRQQRRFTIGTFPGLTTEQAREIAGKALAEIALGNDPAEQRQQARREAANERAATLAGFLETYAPWLKTHRKDGAASVQRIRSCFAGWMEKPLADLTPWLLEKWRKERREAGRSDATINRDMNALRSLLSTAVEWGVIDHDPLSGIKRAKIDSSAMVRYLSAEEEQRLRLALRARDDRMKAQRGNANQWRITRHQEPLPSLQSLAYVDHLEPIILLALNTGMRRGELFALQWSDIDLERRTLTVRGSSAKSGKTRHIPLNTEATHTLTQWRKQGSPAGLVFPGKAGAPLDNINNAWRRLLKAAQITGFRFHDLHHTFASKLVMAGVDLNTVRELLGHSDIAMTLRYAHLAPAHKAAAVELLNKTATANVVPIKKTS
jgi:integrase